MRIRMPGCWRGPVRRDRGGPTPPPGRNVGRKIRARQWDDGRDPAEPSSPVVAVQAWVKGGQHHGDRCPRGMSTSSNTWPSRDEAQGPGEIAREVEAVGGEINAYTSFDQTVYHITLSGRFLENALDILADTLANSSSIRELSRELEVILEEVRMNEDNPGGSSTRRSSGSVQGPPYGAPSSGSSTRSGRHARGSPRLLPRNYVPGTWCW